MHFHDRVGQTHSVTVMGESESETKGAEALPAIPRSNASQIFAAIAVALIAFWAPGEGTNVVLRILGSCAALGLLLLGSVGVEMVMDQLNARKKPKANPFEVVTIKADVPTAPPGGIFEAACNMSTHLNVSS